MEGVNRLRLHSASHEAETIDPRPQTFNSLLRCQRIARGSLLTGMGWLRKTVSF